MSEKEPQPEVEIEAAEADLNLKLNALLERQPAFDNLQKRMEEVRDLKGIDRVPPQEFIERYFFSQRVFEQLKLAIEDLEIRSGKKPPIDEEEIEQRIRGAVKEMVRACGSRENFEVVFQDIRRAEEKSRWLEENEDFVSDLDQLNQTYLSFTKNFRRVPEKPTFLTLKSFQKDLGTCSMFFKGKRPGSFYTVINLARGKFRGRHLERVFKYDKKHSQEAFDQIFGERLDEKRPEILIEEGVEIDFFEEGKEGEELMKLAETVVPRDTLCRLIRQMKVTNAEGKPEIPEMSKLGNFSGEYGHRLRRITIFRDGQSLELPHLLAHEFAHSLYAGSHLNLLKRLKGRSDWLNVVFNDDARITTYIDETAQVYGARSPERFNEDFCDSFSEFVLTPAALAEASEKRFLFMKHYVEENFPEWDVTKSREQIRELENLYFERVAENFSWIRKKVSDSLRAPEKKRFYDLFNNPEMTPHVFFRDLPQQITCFKKVGGGRLKRQTEGEDVSLVMIFNERTGLPIKIGSMSYDYDRDGNLVRRSFPDGEVNIFTCDKKGKLTKVKTSVKDGRIIGESRFRYPKKGKIVETWQDKDRKFQRKYEYQLDKEGRVKEKVWVDNDDKPVIKILFTYGSQGELLGKRYEDGEGNFIAESKYSYSE